MSKITNDGLTRSGTGCFVAVPMATVGVKGLILQCRYLTAGILSRQSMIGAFNGSPLSIPAAVPGWGDIVN